MTGGCAGDLAPTDYADQLSEKVTTDAVYAHLEALQRIAEANGDTRYSGTPGYVASVDYVVKALRDKGFDVQTPEFEFSMFDTGNEILRVDGESVDAHAVEFSGASPAKGVHGDLVPVAAGETPGCLPSDYDGLPVGGAVVLVDRGGCNLSDKVAVAAGRGAIAVVIANNVEEKVFSAALLESDHARVPVLSVTKADGARIRSGGREATVSVDAWVKRVTARSVVAQTTTGSTEDVVVVGAHLDSVRRGPGINDDGTGVAAVLETAMQMGGAPDVANAVRFAFWGAEEAWLVGSTEYVKSLAVEQLEDIGLYLNFDMLGSPNAGYFVLNGAASQDPDTEMPKPEGSAGIAAAFTEHLADVGVTTQPFPFDGRGDYGPFAETGIPSGALFTGAEEAKTSEQAGLWGGSAGVPFDPNYHSADDVLANVDRAALEVTAPAVAYVVGLYAQGGTDAHRVPERDARDRKELAG